MEHVIIAGGVRDDDDGTPVLLDDVEILDWVENSQWKMVSVHLPVPMFALQLTASNDHLFVVGYCNAKHLDNHVYKLPIALITNSAKQLQCGSTRWVKLAKTTHWGSSLVTSLSPLIVFGG